MQNNAESAFFPRIQNVYRVDMYWTIKKASIKVKGLKSSREYLNYNKIKFEHIKKRQYILNIL